MSKSLRQPFASFAEPRPIDNIVKTAMCRALSILDKSTLDDAAERYYGRERGFRLVTKGSVLPATSTTSGWAANVMQTAQGVMASLAGQAAFRHVLAACSQQAYRFDHTQRKVVVPVLPANNTDFIYVPESGMIPVIGSAGTVSSIALEPRLLPVIVTLTSEAVRRSLPNAEIELKNKLAVGLTLTGDKFMFDSTIADGTRPGGILAGISPLTASTATPTDAAMRADIAAIVAAVSAVSADSAVILIANPRQAHAYRLAYGKNDSAPYEMFPCSFLPAGTCVALATNCLAHATDPVPDISDARETMLHLDTSPQAGFAAATVVSLFQSDMVAIRLIAEADWALISTSGVAQVASVAW